MYRLFIILLPPLSFSLSSLHYHLLLPLSLLSLCLLPQMDSEVKNVLCMPIFNKDHVTIGEVILPSALA